MEHELELSLAVKWLAVEQVELVEQGTGVAQKTRSA
jgi:hypothetical protein